MGTLSVSVEEAMVCHLPWPELPHTAIPPQSIKLRCCTALRQLLKLFPKEEGEGFWAKQR